MTSEQKFIGWANQQFGTQASRAFKAEVIQIAVSDETTPLTTGANKVTFRMPFAMTLTEVRGSVSTAPGGSGIALNVTQGGSNILGTVLSIDDGWKTSVGATTPAVISNSDLTDDAEMTIDITAVGSSTAGAGLKVTLIGYRV